jgi:hypothetical protein
MGSRILADSKKPCEGQAMMFPLSGGHVCEFLGGRRDAGASCERDGV